MLKSALMCLSQSVCQHRKIEGDDQFDGCLRLDSTSIDPSSLFTWFWLGKTIFLGLMAVYTLSSGVTRNSGAPGQNIQVGPLPWVSTVSPLAMMLCMEVRGVVVSTVAPRKVPKMIFIFVVGDLFCRILSLDT